MLYQVQEGVKDIKVGTLIALTVDVDEDWKSVEMPDTVPTASAAPPPPPSPSAVTPPTSAPAQPPPGQYVFIKVIYIIFIHISSPSSHYYFTYEILLLSE